jgi:hypothetical protein
LYSPAYNEELKKKKKRERIILTADVREELGS